MDTKELLALLEAAEKAFSERKTGEASKFRQARAAVAQLVDDASNAKELLRRVRPYVDSDYLNNFQDTPTLPKELRAAIDALLKEKTS